MLYDKYKILGISVITVFIIVTIGQIQPLLHQQHLSFAQTSTQSLSLSENISNSSNSNMKSILDKSLNNTKYSTFKNATTPAVGVDPVTNAIYVIYFKNESRGANLYLQKSLDLGKTFSNPVRVNDAERLY